MSGHLSWLEAGVVGLFQGVAELFPISSLGHAVLIPAWVGGSWATDLDVSSPESPYLAFIVGLHVATAAALIIYFWRDWVRILHGLATSLAHRQIANADQRLAWLLVVATIPVGLVGLLGEHFIRVHLGKPVPAAIFLTLNGLILLGVGTAPATRSQREQRVRRRTRHRRRVRQTTRRPAPRATASPSAPCKSPPLLPASPDPVSPRSAACYVACRGRMPPDSPSYSPPR